jgi:hypothetical protein
MPNVINERQRRINKTRISFKHLFTYKKPQIARHDKGIKHEKRCKSGGKGDKWREGEGAYPKGLTTRTYNAGAGLKGNGLMGRAF